MKLTNKRLQSDGAAHDVGIECVGYGAAELLAEGVGVKFLNIHYGSEILAREPALAFATVGFADVAGVATRSIAPCAIIDEKAVGIKCLFEGYVDELAVCGHGYADC